MLEGEAQWENPGGCSGWILRFSCVDSLEYHSNMIADAVKKVIKVGKVSSEGSQGLSTICWGT